MHLLDDFLVILGDRVPTHVTPNTPLVELVVELVRRLEFPTLLSRFEAVFAWEAIEEARAFLQQFGQNQGQVLHVEGQVAGRHDLNQLYLGGTTIGSWMFARRYWAGLVGPRPRWEILLVSLVLVVVEVEWPN